MTTLFLVSGFVAFFIAVVEQLVDLRAFKALLCLILSAGAVAIVGGLTTRQEILYTVGGAFFGPMLALATDKMSTFTQAVVRTRE